MGLLSSGVMSISILLVVISNVIGKLNLLFFNLPKKFKKRTILNGQQQLMAPVYAIGVSDIFEDIMLPDISALGQTFGVPLTFRIKNIGSLFIYQNAIMYCL